jgi:hypothetical protein
VLDPPNTATSPAAELSLDPLPTDTAPETPVTATPDDNDTSPDTDAPVLLNDAIDTLPLPMLPDPLDNDNEPPVPVVLGPPTTETLPAVPLEEPELTITLPLMSEVASPDDNVKTPDEDDTDDPLPTVTAPLELTPDAPALLKTYTRPLVCAPAPDVIDTVPPIVDPLSPPENDTSPPTELPDVLDAAPPESDKLPAVPLVAASEPPVTRTLAPPTVPSELSPADSDISPPTLLERLVVTMRTTPSGPDVNDTEPP